MISYNNYTSYHLKNVYFRQFKQFQGKSVINLLVIKLNCIEYFLFLTLFREISNFIN